MIIEAQYYFLSLIPVTIGIVVVALSHRSAARRSGEFKLWRVMALLIGGLLSVSPVWLLSYSLLESHPKLSAIYFLGGLILSIHLPAGIIYLFRGQRLVQPFTHDA